MDKKNTVYLIIDYFFTSLLRSFSPNFNLVRRTIDLNYANKKRASSLKWVAVHGVLLAIFTIDLWCKCPGHTTALHYVEAVLCACAAASLLRHARRLLPSAAAPPLHLTPHQLRLLGLKDDDLDSSFRVSRASPPAATDPAAPERDAWPPAALALAPRPASPAAPASPVAPRTPPSPPPSPERSAAIDEFIADRRSLGDYLRQYEERARDEAGTGVGAGAMQAGPVGWHLPLPSQHYQLATIDKEGGGGGGGGGGGVGGGGGGGAEESAPQTWHHLALAPRHLAQYDLNLRRWIHMTILERLVREMELVDALLAAGAGVGAGAGGGVEARVGEVSLERLAGAAPPPHPAHAPLAQLLPFLDLHPDQRYLVRRIRELAQGGCLSAYRWSGGGAGWDEARPADAELVLHLVARYLDAQLPGGGAPFSSRHVSAAPPAPAPPPRASRTLVLHRAARRPPHYVLLLPHDTLEVGRGRDNLLHSLLVFVALAARASPPALHRVHLGPAGLNMLWIIGR